MDLIPSIPHVILLKYYVQGRPTPVNARREFIRWLTSKAGDSKAGWQFDLEQLPDTLPAHTKIFVISVRIELALVDEGHLASDNIQDLREILRSQTPPFLQGGPFKPLFVKLSTPEINTGLGQLYTGFEFLNGFPTIEKDGEIERGKSSVGEAILESLYISVAPSFFFYYLYKGATTFLSKESLEFTKSMRNILELVQGPFSFKFQI
ncbi:hypothetical protein N7528_009771 [Penicillium herquei]|nr:hypothetical protein N7528_009771 [Penicillium herquei]